MRRAQVLRGGAPPAHARTERRPGRSPTAPSAGPCTRTPPEMKRAARGFRDIEYFGTAIFLRLGAWTSQLRLLRAVLPTRSWEKPVFRCARAGGCRRRPGFCHCLFHGGVGKTPDRPLAPVLPRAQREKCDTRCRFLAHDVPIAPENPGGRQHPDRAAGGLQNKRAIGGAVPLNCRPAPAGQNSRYAVGSLARALRAEMRPNAAHSPRLPQPL